MDESPEGADGRGASASHQGPLPGGMTSQTPAGTCAFDPRLITGKQGEVATIVCLGCFTDVPVRGLTWRACACGKFKCANCARKQCLSCGRVPAERHAAPWPAVISLHHAQGDAAALNFNEVMASAWDTAHSAQQPSGTRTGLLQCASCHRDSHSCHEGWRICSCRLVYCAQCCGEQCEACGQIIWHDLNGAAEKESWQGSDISHADSSAHEGDDGLGDGAAPAHLAMPSILTPAAAAARRLNIMEEAAAARRVRRAKGRALAKAQIAQGLRPRRQRRTDAWTTFATANITTAEKLKEDIMIGGELTKCDFLGVQEHALHGCALAEAESWIARAGWAGVLDEAYYKCGGHGGGTAALSRHPAGLRRAGSPVSLLKGRLTLSVTQLITTVTFGVFYGLSGGSALAQRPLWKVLVDAVAALGRPCVLAGDWQVPPDVVRRSGMLEALDAEICAPNCATNMRSGGKLDYFIVSRSLLQHGWRIRPIYGCNIRTHVPIVLEINVQAPSEPTRRLQQPRLLPVDAPDPRQEPKLIVDWSQWKVGAGTDAAADAGMSELAESMDEWYAGAEAELLSQYGLADHPSEEAYMGIGRPPTEIIENTARRFRIVPDAFGLVGHRLEWACSALHLIISLAPLIIAHAAAAGNSDSSRIATHVDTLSRLGHRACSFAREEQARPNDNDADAFWPLVKQGMRRIGELVRNRHGRRPRLCVWKMGLEGDDTHRFRSTADELDDALKRLARERTRKHRAKLRKWADSLPDDAGHKVTKCPEASLTITASADKAHLGERTPQGAADAGERSWSPTWHGRKHDQADDFMDALDDMTADPNDDGYFPEIVLPPIEPHRLAQVARQVRANSGVGGDWARVAHIGRYLTLGALKALCRWFEAVERFGRWPALVRSVIEIALTKKAGGARLIGLAASLYRVWARLRYHDVRAALELRLARPELAAAPGRGAMSTALELALATETAAARDAVSATTAVDIAKFFDCVEVSELARPALRIGIPKRVLALTSHFYLGIRRLRVGRAYSAGIYPRRGIVPGCTWCTVYVRVVVIGPLDGMTRQLKKWICTWGVDIICRMYIDDVLLTTLGNRSNVAMVHAWASEHVLAWVKLALKKRVADAKLHCVAADKELRSALRQRLAPSGFRVAKLGEVLGTDFSGGGHLTRRRLQEKRRRRTKARRKKLRWWHKLKGNGGRVVDNGLFPSDAYGMQCGGLPPAVLRDARRTRGAFARIKCQGASLTAKLATAGPNYADVDPASRHPAPPLRALHELLWDFPQMRFTFVFAWRGAVRDFIDDNRPWSKIRGPVGAAMCHLRRLGVQWVAPFRIVADTVPIDLLKVPPRQAYMFLQDVARVALDRQLVDRLAISRGWDRDSVAARYQKGIDWPMTRRILAAKNLQPTERRALQVAMAGGCWSDERRWLAGMTETPSCTLCNEEVGDEEHFFTGRCAAVDVALWWRRVAGQDASTPELFSHPSLAPLVTLAFPPRTTSWRPTPDTVPEGWLSMGGDTPSYGDGSGYRQQFKCCRNATWSIVRIGQNSGGEWERREALRGVVPGLFPTVPRAEITALIQHLRHAGIGACYGGDCKHVIDAASHGVSPYLTSARSMNADLWQDVRALLHDHGAAVRLKKIKAHATLDDAIINGASHMDWVGNRMADEHCKELAKSIADADTQAQGAAQCRSNFKKVIDRIIFVVKWSFRHRQQFAKRTAAKSTRRPGRGEGSHAIEQFEVGKWRCTVCRQEAWSTTVLAKMSKSQCHGHIARECHPSHELDVTLGT